MAEKRLINRIIEASKAASKTDKKTKKKKTETVKKGRTLTGEPATKIDFDPTLEEALKGSTAVVSFGRMNPPTIGHAKLVAKVQTLARRLSATPMVFLSQSHDEKKNPLPYQEKFQLARKAFGPVITDCPRQYANMIGVAKYVSQLSKYDNLVMVVGSDRVQSIQSVLQRYNGSEYQFDQVQVVSAGERDPDSKGATGMSASKMRQFAREGNLQKFKAGLPQPLRTDAAEIMQDVKDNLRVFTSESLQEENQWQEFFDRIMNQDIVQKEPDLPSLVVLTSRQIAVRVLLDCYLNGEDYDSLSVPEKSAIDERVLNNKRLVLAISKRILPLVYADRLKQDLQNKYNDENGLTDDFVESLVDQLQSQMYIDESLETPNEVTEIINELSSSFDVPADILESVYARGQSAGQDGMGRMESFLVGDVSEDFDLFVEMLENE